MTTLADVDELRRHVPADGEAAAMEHLPAVVLAAVQMAEQRGGEGSAKKVWAESLVSMYYSSMPQAVGENPVFSIAAEVLALLVPTLIDHYVSIDNGKLTIDPRKQSCLTVCCPLMCLGAKAGAQKLGRA